MNQSHPKKIFLASGSPRRRELLEQIGLPFEVMISEVDETTEYTSPQDVVRDLSAQKAQAVWQQLSREQQEESVVLGADTIVAYEGAILGKPKDAQDAHRMLVMLSGRTHQVYTGVTFCSSRGKESIFACTDVTLYEITDEEIRAYINTGEPMDKAGAYGIQGAFAAYVKEIRGDYNNVVGLPVGLVYQTWKKL